MTDSTLPYWSVWHWSGRGHSLFLFFWQLQWGSTVSSEISLRLAWTLVLEALKVLLQLFTSPDFADWGDQFMADLKEKIEKDEEKEKI